MARLRKNQFTAFYHRQIMYRQSFGVVENVYQNLTKRLSAAVE
jgi:hypothetical protein